MKLKRTVTFSLLLFICSIMFGNIPAQAAEDTFPAPKIESITSAGYSTVMLEVDSTSSANLHVYRASSKNGKYKLVDSVSLTGWWSIDSNGLYYKIGEKGSCTCYKKEDNSGYYLYVDGAAFNKKRYYKIRVSTSSGLYSEYSNVVSGKTKLGSVSVTNSYAVSNTSVKLKWNKVSGANGYQIYRKTSGGKWEKVKTIKKGSTLTYTDNSAKSGKTYYYRIRAYRKSGSSKKYGAYSSKAKVQTKTPTVSGTYTTGSVYGPSLSASELDEVRHVVQGFKNNYIKSGMSDYEKVLAAYNYLRDNCSYAWRGWQYNKANTAWGALVYGEAQCSGFARAMKALCDGIGVSCYYVHASSDSSNPDHQWNMVKISGKWYILDAQGGYFLVGSRTWKNLGLRWSSSGLPTCSKKDYSKGGYTGAIL